MTSRVLLTLCRMLFATAGCAVPAADSCPLDRTVPGRARSRPVRHHSVRSACAVRSRVARRCGQAASVFAASNVAGTISTSAHTASGG